MTRLFLAKSFDQSPFVAILAHYFKKEGVNSNMFAKQGDGSFSYKNFSIVEKIEDCDYILLPQYFSAYTGEQKEYIDLHISLGKQYNKKVLLFLRGDLHHDVFIPEAIIFKAFNYRFLRKDNEIYIPCYVEDLSVGRELTIREKTNSKPVVGFCGWAGFQAPMQWLKYGIKNFLVSLKKVLTFNAQLEVFKKGIYFRRKSVKILQQSNLIQTNFKLRKSYSGHRKTISMDPKIARQEFIDNILESDFTLCPKGDANSSARLYEVWSLGRIPVMIDTEIILPLERLIDYTKCSVRVNYTDIQHLPEIIANFYNKLTPEQFKEMQNEAHKAFEAYLRFDSFFNFVFDQGPEKVLKMYN